MSMRFRGWLVVAVASVGAVMALGGCGAPKRGTIPVDSPIYQAPNDDPSAEEEEEKESEGSEPEGESKAPAAKPAGGKGSREAAASSKR